MAVTRTCMYNTGVPEKIISDISGHKHPRHMHMRGHLPSRRLLVKVSTHSGKLFIPAANKEIFDNRSTMVKCASLELSATANEAAL